MSKCITFFDLWKSCCLAGRSVILCPWECAPRCSRIPGKTRSITASGKWTCYIVWPMRKHAENDALPQLFMFSPWQAGALITQWVPPAWGTWHAKLRLANPAAFCLGQASFHRSWPHSAITSMHGPVVWHCHTPVVNTYGIISMRMRYDEMKWWHQVWQDIAPSYQFQRNLLWCIAMCRLVHCLHQLHPRRLVLDALPPAGHRNGLLWGIRSPSVNFKWFLIWDAQLTLVAWCRCGCFIAPKLRRLAFTLFADQSFLNFSAAFNLTP